jgi:hypothetical protein
LRDHESVVARQYYQPGLRENQVEQGKTVEDRIGFCLKVLHEELAEVIHTSSSHF